MCGGLHNCHASYKSSDQSQAKNWRRKRKEKGQCAEDFTIVMVPNPVQLLQLFKRTSDQSKEGLSTIAPPSDSMHRISWWTFLKAVICWQEFTCCRSWGTNKCFDFFCKPCGFWSLLFGPFVGWQLWLMGFLKQECSVLVLVINDRIWEQPRFYINDAAAAPNKCPPRRCWTWQSASFAATARWRRSQSALSLVFQCGQCRTESLSSLVFQVFSHHSLLWSDKCIVLQPSRFQYALNPTWNIGSRILSPLKKEWFEVSTPRVKQ